MPQTPLDDALNALSRADPGFNEEIRRRIAPVKDRFFTTVSSEASGRLKDGLHSTPAYLSDPDLKRITIELAEWHT